MDSIDCSDLNTTLKLIIDKKIHEFKTNLENFGLKKIDEKRISIHGCKINVATMVFDHCISDEIISGWSILQNSIAMDILSKLLLINTIYKTYMIEETGEISIKKDIYISNKFPDIITLLSLCYWVNTCKSLIDPDNFKIKMNELNHNFASEPLNHTYQEVLKLVILKLNPTEKEQGKNYTKSKIYKVKQWVEAIVSFTSEFMLCSIIKQRNLDINFISSTSKIKRCDIFVNGYYIEIKSIIDAFEYGIDVANSLPRELVGTMQRCKITDDLNDSLQKENIDFVILNVSSSSLGMGIVKYTHNKTRTLDEVLEKCFNYSDNIRRNVKTFLPVLVFLYFIDAINSHFVISPCVVKYPVKNIDGNYAVDKSALIEGSIEI